MKLDDRTGANLQDSRIPIEELSTTSTQRQRHDRLILEVEETIESSRKATQEATRAIHQIKDLITLLHQVKQSPAPVPADVESHSVAEQSSLPIRQAQIQVVEAAPTNGNAPVPGDRIHILSGRFRNFEANVILIDHSRKTLIASLVPGTEVELLLKNVCPVERRSPTP